MLVIFVNTANVVIQFVSAGESLWTIFAIIRESSIKVNVFHVFPKIAPICANFAAHCASVILRTKLRGLHYVLIQLLVPSCKQQ